MKKIIGIALIVCAITLMAQSQANAGFRVGIAVPGVVATFGVPGPYYYPAPVVVSPYGYYGYHGPGYYSPGYFGYYGRGYYGRGYWRGYGHGWGHRHGRWGGRWDGR
jgi:hypothetical protein